MWHSLYRTLPVAASDMGMKCVNFKINFDSQNASSVMHLHFLFAKTVTLSKQPLKL